MKTAIIWDLDGTLLDSYHVIVESLQLALKDFGVELSYEYIWQFAIDQSSSALIQKIAEEHKIPAEQILAKYSGLSRERYMGIRLMKHAKQILDATQSRGVENFVYTHRGRTTVPALEYLGIAHYFKEVLTSQSGFLRKPAPDAINYLLEKYGLDPASTYYAGDRSLDMECARNAGIHGILYLPKDSRGSATGIEDHIVEDLMDIASIV